MTQIKQSNTGDVRRPEAKNMIDQIKQLLRATGTNELSLEKVKQPARALWRDNNGDPQESVVLGVGMDDDGDLFLTLEDDCGGEVQIWESYGQISDNDLKTVLESIQEYMAERDCDNSDRLVITDDEGEVFEVITTPTVNPEMFRRRVKCLTLSGLSQEEAEKFVASTPLQLELFYDVGLGAFAIDAEAVGNTPLYNPFTAKEIQDETNLEESDKVIYTLPNGAKIELLSEMRQANCEFGDFDETIEELREAYHKADKEAMVDIENRIEEQCDAYANFLGMQHEEIQGLIGFNDLSIALKHALLS